MTHLLLTIQIPYTEEREEEKDRLIAEFERQISVFRLEGLIEIQTDGTGKEMTIGEKRSNLYARANGKFTVQWDSDDWISSDGLWHIIQGCKEDVSVITYRELCVMNGEIKKSDHSIFYEKWQDNTIGWDYVRCPFFKNPIRTEIAQSVEVPKIRWNEDEQFSYAIKPFLTSEHHIDEYIYQYIYSPKDTAEERYGLSIR